MMVMMGLIILILVIVKENDLAFSSFHSSFTFNLTSSTCKT